MTSVDPVTGTVAAACRVLAATGLVEHVLGHISARVAPDRLVLRCRGPQESGLAYSTDDDIRSVPLDGAPDVAPWSVPNELPIHRVLLRRRPELTAVVHAHPPAVVAHSLLDRPLLPLYGAYDIPGAALAAGGIPVWPRAALIRTDALAEQMAGTLGDRPVAVLRGHGLVSVAGGPPQTAVAQAVLQAVAVDTLARTTLRVLQAGGTPEPISPADLAELPDLGAGFTVATMWRHLLRRADGLDTRHAGRLD
jgi:ribulose-5-phosphate 4-epimerase/fuculose-1-phosphate aldolase